MLILAGFQVAYPDRLALSDVFTPLGVETIETGWHHLPIHHLSDVIDRIFRLKSPILNHPPKNWDAWSKAMSAGFANLASPSAECSYVWTPLMAAPSKRASIPTTTISHCRRVARTKHGNG